MAQYKVEPSLAGILNAQDIINGIVGDAVQRAIARTCTLGVAQWQEAVMRAPGVWQGEKQRYADSISWKETGPYSAEIVASYRFAADIETGRPARDMHDMLDTSLKVKIAANGKKYLTIPFRHSAESLKTAGVYAQAKALKPSSIAGTGKRLSMQGAIHGADGMLRSGVSDPKTKRAAMVPQHAYNWGQQMRSENSRLNGLYRFNTSAGGGKSSSYLTFRTLMEGSGGWIIKAKPGLFIAQGVAQGLEKTLQEEIGRELAASLKS